jgi:hypothetical protein
MNIQNQRILDSLLKKFSSGFVIHEFHKEWAAFLSTLPKSERTIATRSLLNSILDNAKAFRQEATHIVENGTDQERQWLSESINDLKEHPFFTRIEVGA